MRTHGGYAITRALKQGKSLDKRFRIAKQVHAMRDNLVAECSDGKPSQAQLIILDRIVEKVVFLMALSQYAMDQDSVVDEKGRMLPCLGQNYLGYSEGLRRDLLALSQLGLRLKESDLYEKWRQTCLKGVNDAE